MRIFSVVSGVTSLSLKPVPPVESIKSILNHIESGVFYFPMTSYFDAIGLSRFQSNMKFLREFYPYNFLEMLL